MSTLDKSLLYQFFEISNNFQIFHVYNFKSISSNNLEGQLKID